MPAQWTADIVGEMHLVGISSKTLAEHMGLHPKYVSAILNGHRAPSKAEQKFRAALDELIALKNSTAVSKE